MGNTQQGKRAQDEGLGGPSSMASGLGSHAMPPGSSAFDFDARTRSVSGGSSFIPLSGRDRDIRGEVPSTIGSSSVAEEADVLNQMVQAAAGDEPTLNLHVTSTGPSGGSIEAPPTTRLPTVIRWEAGGKEVLVSGSFNNWKGKIPLVKSQDSFYTIVELPEGEHQYKFYVDGVWRHSEVQPTVTNTMGTLNNMVHVKASDFEVFRALAADSSVPASTAPSSSPGASSTDANRHASSLATPHGVFTHEIPSRRALEIEPGPPWLPPHLLQVILNRDTAPHYDPSLLPEPNHVMLNHLYALSIRDGVMVLSATHRYRKKYVTTLLYKPI